MPSIKELEKWMTTKQVKEALGVSRQSVLNMAEDKRVRAVKVGGEVWIYDPSSVERYKAERTEEQSVKNDLDRL